MNKIKVVRIIARLNIGGPAQHVTILTEGLDAQRYDTLLVYGSVDSGEGDMSYLLRDTTKRELLPELGRGISPFNDIRAFLKLVKIIRQERPEIVHTHTAKAGTIGRLAAIICGVPIRAHTFHGHIFSGYFNKFATGYFLFIERLLACFTDRIIAISETQKTELLNKYKIGTSEKLDVIKLGLDLERFSRSEKMRGVFRKKHGLDDQDILIGIVGRLAPIKNHTMFIRAARLLEDRLSSADFNKVRFIVVGDGPQKSSIMKLSDSLGLSGRVLFTGWETDMASLYAGLDIVALTSLNEGTPLSLIEAMASARPVVATDVGGVRDVVGPAGRLVRSGDDGSFCEELADLIQHPAKRLEAGAISRERALKMFSSEELIKNIQCLYEELIAKKGLKLR